MKRIYSLIAALFITSIGYGQTVNEYFKSGYKKFELQDYKGAITDITKSIELDSSNSNLDLYNIRGLAKYEVQDCNGAIADLTKALEVYSDTGEDYNIVYVADYTKAIEIVTMSAVESSVIVLKQAYNDRGIIRCYLKNYTGAINDCTKAIELDPGLAQAYFGRGMAKVLLKQNDSGCLDLIKAGELGYSDPYNAIKKYCQ